MEESFFGIDTDTPTLGFGDGLKTKDAPFDGNIDLMNDETFGDGATDGDWEEEHEKLANSDFSGLKSQEFKSHEDELEHSIRQLVVDDEEEERGGVPIVGHAGLNLASQVTNLDDLFGPGSPPGLLHTDMILGSGQNNIWGSPRTREGQIHQQQQEEGLKSLLKQLQTTRAGPQQFQDPSIVMSGKTLSTSLPSAKTLNEIELAMAAPPPPQHPAGGDAPPRRRALTLEELEAQLHATPPPPLPNTSVPPPPLHHPPGRHHPPGMPSLEELEAAMRSGQPPPPMPPITQPPPTLPHTHTPPPTSMPLPIGTPPQGAPFMQQAALQRQPMEAPPVNIPGGQRMRQAGHQGTPPIGISGVGTPPQSDLTASTPPQHVNPQRISPPNNMADGSNTNGPQGNHSGDPQKQNDFKTTPKQRMLAPAPFSDPSHMSIHQGGYHNQLPGPQPHNVRQSLFPNSVNRGRGGAGGPSLQRPCKDNLEGYDNGHYGYRDNRNFNRDNYNHDRDNFYSNRGDFRNNKGDFRNIRGDFHDSRGYHDNRGGDYRDNRGGDYRDNRGGDYRDNRGGDYRDNRGGDYYDNRDDYGYRDRGGDYYCGKRGGHFQSRPRHDSYGYDYDEEEDNPNKDPYAGLMSKKEKDWIIKIQLMQLQTDNPYLDDYYYTAWQVNKIAAEQRKKQSVQSQSSTDIEPKLVLPQLAGRIENRAYKPVQFENSLGRLTAASVHNPRHIIDVSVERPADKDEKSQEPRRYKELLLHIEMSYNILLDIDDIEKKAVVLPEEARLPLLEERQTNINQLYQRVVHQTNQAKHFSKVVAVRKGAKLVARIIPLLQLNEATDLVCALLRHLGAISKKEWQREVLPPVYHSMSNVISMANLETLVRFADAARQGGLDPASIVAAALQNAFGASVIWCLVNRGEQVYATEDPLDMDVEHQNAWRDFVAVVAEVLAVMSKDQVATPKGTFKAVRHHFERLIDKRTYISIEDKLQQLQHTRAS